MFNQVGLCLEISRNINVMDEKSKVAPMLLSDIKNTLKVYFLTPMKLAASG